MDLNLRDLLPWVWAIIAMSFLAAEIFTAGFVLLCFGIGAAAAALIAFLGPGMPWQLLTFILVSGISVLLSRPFSRRIIHANSQAFGSDRLIGQQGVVLEPIAPDIGRGIVRVDHEQWSADSADGVTIPQGARVIVLAVDGAHLKVRMVPEGVASSA